LSANPAAALSARPGIAAGGGDRAPAGEPPGQTGEVHASQKEQHPYGLWDSPLRPEHLSAAVRFRDVAWDRDGRALVWLEERGADNVIVCQARPPDFA